MTSVVSICNRALTLLGQKTITSLEDNSQAARLCVESYGPTRDAVLRDHPWNCAIARADLAALSEAPAFEFGRQFQLPPDCLRVLELWGSRARWKIEGRRLLSDVDRSEEHTSELQSLMRISYAVFCLKKTTHKMKYDNNKH